MDHNVRSRTRASLGPAASGGKPVLVVRKLRRVLDQFGPERPSLTLRQIETGTGLPHATCARLVQNLLAEGFLERSGGTYRIGLHLLHWAAAATADLDLPGKAQPILDELRDATGETTTLYVRQGRVRICLAVAQSRKQVVVRQVAPGRIMPLHAGSAGRVLTAFDETALGREAAGTGEPGRGALQQTRDLGYAVSLNETDAGVSSVSAPVLDATGQVVALSIVAPTERLTDGSLAGHIAAVRAAAARLSRQLGGRPPASVLGAPAGAPAASQR